MELCRYLRGTNAAGSYQEISRTDNMYRFLVKEIGAESESDVIDRILSLYAGFTKMPDYPRYHWLEKPAAIRCAPLYLEVFPGMPETIKPFFAVGVCGMENRGNEGKWSSGPHSRDTNYTQIDMFPLDSLFSSKEYSHLDLMFGIRPMTDEDVMNVRNGRVRLEQTIRVEHVEPKMRPDDRAHVLAAVDAIYAGKNVVIHLEPGVSFRQRAREVLLEIYSMLQPYYAVKVGYSMYQFPGSISEITKAWSVRIFVVPGEQPLPSFDEGLKIVDMNTPCDLPQSRAGAVLNKWWQLASERRMRAFKQLFADTEKTYADAELFIQRSNEFFTALQDLNSWFRQKQQGSIIDLQQLKAEFDLHPTWELIPWAWEVFCRKAPQLIASGVTVERLVADTYADVIFAADKGHRTQLEPLLQFGMKLSDPDLKQLLKRYNQNFDETFEARTENALQGIRSELAAAHSTADQLQTQLGKTQKKVADLESDKAELIRARDDLTLIKEQLITDKEKLKTASNLLREQNQTLEKGLGAAKRSIETLTSRNEDLKTQVNSFIQDYGSPEMLRDTILDLNQKAASLRDVESVLDSKVASPDLYEESSAAGQMVTIILGKNALERQLRQNEGTIKALQKDRDLLSEVRAALPEPDATTEETLPQLITALRNERDDLKEELAKIGDALRTATSPDTPSTNEAGPALIGTRSIDNETPLAPSDTELTRFADAETGMTPAALPVIETANKPISEVITDIVYTNTTMGTMLNEARGSVSTLTEERDALQEKLNQVENLDTLDNEIKEKQDLLKILTEEVTKAKKDDFKRHIGQYLLFALLGALIALIIMLIVNGFQDTPKPPVIDNPPASTSQPVEDETTAPSETTDPIEATDPSGNTDPVEDLAEEGWLPAEIKEQLRDLMAEQDMEIKTLIDTGLEEYFPAESGIKAFALFSPDAASGNDLPERHILLLDVHQFTSEELAEVFDQKLYAYLAVGDLRFAIKRSSSNDSATEFTLALISNMCDITGNPTKWMQLSVQMEENEAPRAVDWLLRDVGGTEWYRSVTDWCSGKSTRAYRDERELKYQPNLVVTGKGWSVFFFDRDKLDKDPESLNALSARFTKRDMDGMYVFIEKTMPATPD